MNCKPAHIHLKQDAVPFAAHVPIPVPIHWKEQVKANLDKDVKDGVIEAVPVGEPVVWCSPMFVTAKKRWKTTLYCRSTEVEHAVPTRTPPLSKPVQTGMPSVAKYKEDCH